MTTTFSSYVLEEMEGHDARFLARKPRIKNEFPASTHMEDDNDEGTVRLGLWALGAIAFHCLSTVS